MTVLAVALGLVLLIPAAYVVLMLLGWLIFYFLAGGFPAWMEVTLFWAGVALSTAAGVCALRYGVR